MAGVPPNELKPTIALIGTLDTKQEEYQYAVTFLEDRGCRVCMLDVSTRAPSAVLKMGLGSETWRPEPQIEQVDESKQVRGNPLQWDRLRLRAACLVKLVALQSTGDLNAIASFGGSQNTSFATSIMRATEFPLGLPKFVLSTMASGDTSQYIGESDICIMPSVGDISGTMNAITRLTLRTALSAIFGMAQHHLQSAATQESPIPSISSKPMIALSMFGVTTVAVNQISQILTQRGFQPVAFHATGLGGKTMERLIRQQYFKVVIDLTTTELCDHLYGGVLSAGPDRLTAAAASHIPQIVSVGALDMINFGPMASLPARYKLLDQDTTDQNPLRICEDGTKVYRHNSEVTLIRMSQQQSKEVGALLVDNIAKGLRHNNTAAGRAPTHIMLPTRGVSALDSADGVWDDPTARDVLFTAMEDTLKDQQAKDSVCASVSLTKHDLHINSLEFAHVIAAQAIELAQTTSR